jgi:hypothetical protein
MTHTIWSTRQLGDLGVLRGVVNRFSEEARTRGIASLVFTRFAFIEYGADLIVDGKSRQFGDIPRLESVIETLREMSASGH